jgi:hypothetical protein
MKPPPWRLALVLVPLLPAGCGPSGPQRTTQTLNDRLLTLLAPSIVLGDAALQPLPDGARVTLLGSRRFPNTSEPAGDRNNQIAGSVVQALLDPRLMQIDVTDTTSLPLSQRTARVREAQTYFVNYGLGPTLLQGAPLHPPRDGIAPVPAGLVLTISVRCPPGHDPIAYWNGLSDPVCD